jgi:hypothetical protein
MTMLIRAITASMFLAALLGGGTAFSQEGDEPGREEWEEALDEPEADITEPLEQLQEQRRPIDDRRNDGFGSGEEGTRLFSGWMFASNPALNALDHPVYDVWVIDCRS